MGNHLDLQIQAKATERPNFAYVLANRQLTILSGNKTINHWIEGDFDDFIGRPLPELFPELVGVENVLSHLADNQEEPFTLSKIHRPDSDEFGRYFDLHIEPFFEGDASLLVMVSDVTEEARLEQQLRQERNELRLNIIERQRAEAELQKLSQSLEAQVEARANELAHSNNLITTLSRIAIRVYTAPDPDSALQTLGAELNQVDINCFVALLNPDSETLTLRFASLTSKMITLAEQLVGVEISNGLHIPRNYSLYHRDVVEQKQTLFVADMAPSIIARLPHISQELIQQFLQVIDISAETKAVYVPLLIEDRVLGIMGLWSEALRETDCVAASILASQLAVALERARLLDALRKSEARYRMVAELTSDYAYAIRVEPDGTPIWEWLTEAFTHITSFTLAEVYDRGWLSFIYPEDLPTALQHLEKLMAGQATASEFRIVTKNGQVRWLRDHGYPILDKRQGLVVYIYGAAQNITEHKQAEEAVRLAEQRYRELFEGAPLMYVLARNDENNKPVVEDCNLLFSSLLCYSQEEIVGRPLADFYTPKSRAELLDDDNYQQTLEGCFITPECQLLTSDGRVFETLCRIVPESDANGQPSGLRVMYVDINERKQAEEAVKQAERRYRTLFEEAPVMYVITLEEKNRPIITDCNQLFLSALGYTRSEVLGRPLADFYSAESQIKLTHGYPKALAGKFIAEERELVTRDGRTIKALLHANPEIDAAGKIIGTRAMYVDITERKQMEATLQESEERYRTLVERMREGLLQVNNDDVIEFVNNRFCEMAGYTRDELIGQVGLVILSASEADKNLLKEKNQLRRKGLADVYEMRLKKKTGALIWVQISGAPVTDAQGQVIGSIGVITDISERKHSEEALRRYAARLETMHQIDRGLIAAQSLEEIADSAMKHARDLIPCLRTSVILFDFEQAEVSILAVNFNGETKLGAKQCLSLETFGDIADLRQGQYHLCEDISSRSTHSAIEKQLLTEGIRSVLNLPLLYNNRLIGSFNLGGDKTTIFTDEHIDIAQEVANQLAIAIRSRQFFEENRRRLKELTLLVDASRAVSTTLEIDATLQIIAHQMTYALNVDGCAISLWQQEQDIVKTLMVVGWQKAGIKDVYSLIDYPATRQVLLNCQSLLVQVNDPAADPAEVALLKKFGVETSLIVPLLVRDQAIGLLELESRKKRNYTPTDIDLCQVLANQMAAALENARLFEEAQRHAEELEQRVAERTDELHRANQELQREITERKLVEEALRKSEEQFRLIFELAPTGMAIATIEGEHLRVNRALCELVGYTAAELVGQNFAVITHPDDVAPNIVLDQKLLRNEIPYFQMEKRYIHKQGQIINILLQVALVRDSNGQPLHFISQIVDITERKRAEVMLYHSAFHDALTGLPNRALLREQLERAIEQANEQPGYLFAVLFVDLDRFKIINDSLGHLMGDCLLKTIAHRLEKCVRSKDIVARLGGDEFAILLDNPKSQQMIERVASRIQHEISLPIEIDGQQVFTTASIGIVLNTTPYQQPEELLRDADMAMYRAKTSGRARYELFQSTMYQEAMARLALEAELRRAIEAQEFELYYQPIVSISSGQIVNLEALLRWRHPQRGLLSPIEFLPLAEETGLIMPLGEWALRTACLQVALWSQAEYVSWPIAVNISVYHLQQPNLLEIIEAILEETNLTPELLKLEVTESIAFKNIDHSIQILKRLRTMGVEILIDDFGTGYSSLSHLKQFPANTLKIDQSFVRNIIDDPNDGAIVAAIIAMAHRMGMTVVAEGVETEEQLDFLRIHFCDKAQGYLFSQPLSAEEVTRLLEKEELQPLLPATSL